MKDPDRLLNDPSNPLRTALMRSALGDRAKEGSKERIAKAIGVGAAVHTTTNAAAGTAGKTSALLAKWIGVAIATVTVGALGTLLLSRQHEIAAPVSPSATATVTVAWVPTAEPLPPVPTTADPPTVDVSSLPRAPSARGGAFSTAPQRATGSDSPSLVAELAALDDARASLAAGNPDETLVKLDAYDRQFPVGHLRDEATVLRVEALTRSGDPAAARALGQRFLAASPSSPYAARVRSVAAQWTDGPTDGH